MPFWVQDDIIEAYSLRNCSNTQVFKSQYRSHKIYWPLYTFFVSFENIFSSLNPNTWRVAKHRGSWGISSGFYVFHLCLFILFVHMGRCVILKYNPIKVVICSSSINTIILGHNDIYWVRLWELWCSPLKAL